MRVEIVLKYFRSFIIRANYCKKKLACKFSAQKTQKPYDKIKNVKKLKILSKYV